VQIFPCHQPPGCAPPLDQRRTTNRIEGRIALLLMPSSQGAIAVLGTGTDIKSANNRTLSARGKVLKPASPGFELREVPRRCISGCQPNTRFKCSMIG